MNRKRYITSGRQDGCDSNTPGRQSRFEICILLNVIVPKYECAGEV